LADEGESNIMKKKSYGHGMCGRLFRGFTLIELLIVVAIVAILTAIAYPSYTHYIIKTRRTAAKSCLSEYANFMERYYTTKLTYAGATDPGLDCESTAQTGNYYAWGKPSNLAAATYTLTATPTASQNDTECGALSLTQTGQRGATGTLGTAGCW
jgi:type IV pilus assembly protein PilE